MLKFLSCLTYCVYLFSYAPKIYDCFIFNNELELLDIRLYELYDHVDYFVIVESTSTFTGKPKPLYFAENKERYAQYLDKIIPVVVDNLNDLDNPWKREYYQRDQILKGLTHCHDDDIIIVEDCDEILRPSKLEQIAAIIRSGEQRAVPCILKNYYYFLNRYMPTYQFVCTVVAKYEEVKRRGPNTIRWDERQKTVDNQTVAIEDAGWHFSYMGGLERVIKKLESFAHTECDTPEYKSPERIRKEAKNGLFVLIDQTFPRLVQERIDHYIDIGFIDYFSETGFLE